MQSARPFIRLAIILISLLTFVTAQDVPPARPARPRIGVALSGGGALGLAHIGVIQYFEERHIPIDLVAGTSMGGLIGGFYAAGKNSKDLKGIVDQADWDSLLSPNPRFVDQPVVEKQDWNRTSGSVTFRFGKRFTLPAGLNSGEMLSLLLSRNTLGYSQLSSFDELPTPFRCVATDLVSGEAAVLGSGSLQKALRSTMALPGVFTPVKWDDRVLVDGALVENVPVEVVRSMGADTAIAVTLVTPAAKAEQFNSIFSVLRQTVSIAVTQNERRSIKLADVIIPVNTANYGGTDYAKAHDLIRAGYDAAKAKADELAKFEVSPEQWEEYVRAREQKMKRSPDRASVVEVAAATPSFQQNAKEEVDRKLGSGKVSRGEVEDVLSGIVTATGVPGASYQWKDDPPAKQGFRIEFLDRTGDSLLLRPSFTFSASGGEPSRGSLRVSTTTVFAKAYKSRLLATYTIGYDPGVRSEFYRPFDGSGYFIAPGLMIERFHVNRYDGPTRFDAVRDRFGLTFYGGLGTWRYAQLRFGVQAGYDSYSNNITVDGVQSHSHGFANPEVTWLYNTQDSGELPTRGTRVEGSAGYSFRNTSFPYMRGDISRFQSITPRVSLFGISSYGSSFGKKLNFYDQFTAGGAGKLTAFRYQQFHTNSMVTGGAGLLVRGPSLQSLSLHPSFVAWYEAGRLDLGSQGWQTHQSTSSGIFFPSPLGAIGFAISFDENGKARFRVNLGSLGR